MLSLPTMRSSRIVASLALAAVLAHVVLLALHVPTIARRGQVDAGALFMAIAAPICGALRTDVPAPVHAPASGTAIDCAICSGAVAQGFIDAGRTAAPLRSEIMSAVGYAAPPRSGVTAAAPRDTRSRGPPGCWPAATA